MLPWEHLAFGYLLFSGNARLRHGRPPEQRPAIALAVATQFADLLDEPLAWSVDVLPTPRSLGHSLVFVAAVVAVVALVDRRRGGPAYAPAVAIGYASHLLGVVALWTAGRASDPDGDGGRPVERSRCLVPGRPRTPGLEAPGTRP